MSSVWHKILPLSVLVAALASLHFNPFVIVPFLDKYAGRIPRQQHGVAHIQHGALNNGRCWTNTVGQACEDIRIHQPSGVAFLACGYPETRNVFYPPINCHDTVSASSYREYFLKYDIKSNSTIHLKMEGLDPGHDLILHGIDLLVPTDDSSTIYLFAVNHNRRGEEILLFSHELGSSVLNFVRDFKHWKIKTPNAVAAISPKYDVIHSVEYLDTDISKSSFFITNDHYFYGGTFGGIPRALEDKFAPWKWASDVVYCSAANSSLNCKTVSPPNAHASANGMIVVDDGATLLVNDAVEETTTIYAIDPTTQRLTIKHKVQLGAAADNLSLIPGSEDVAVCVFPDIMKTMARLHDPLDITRQAPAAVLRLIKKKNYEPELLYWDDGSLVTLLTGAAVHPNSHRLVAGGVFSKNFIVCDISNAPL